MKFKKIFLGLFTISAIICLASCKTDTDDPGKKPGELEVVEYKVTFESMGGSKVDSQTVYRGSKATEPTTPTREGYTFKGWYKDSSCTYPWEFDEDVVTGNVTLYAKWTENQVTPPASDKYSVTYVINGHGTQPTNLTEVTALPAELPDLEAEGWTFDGWFTDEDLTTAAVAGATLSANATLYAKWTENQVTPPTSDKYSVTYVINGHGTQPTNLTEVTALPAELPALTAAGWTFGGWFTNEELTTAAVAGATLSANATLYAKWEEITFEISFVSEYGILPKTYKGTILPEELPVLTDTTYVFEGWFLDSDFSENKRAVAGAAISEDTVLYAKWRERTKYDELIEEEQFVVLNNDFNGFTDKDKLPSTDGSWDGKAGLFEGTGDNGKDTPSSTKTYIQLGKGIAELVDKSDGASVNLFARFGNLTSGVVEGYLEVTLSAQGNGWTFFQLNGTDTGKTTTGEIFGIRVDSNKLRYRIDASSSLSDPETTIAADNTKYAIYFMIDLDLGTITVTVNDKKFVTDKNIGITKVSGFKLTSSDGGSKTMTVDNVAVKNMNLSPAEYKEVVKQNARDYLANLNVSSEVKASCQSILDAALVTIDSKNKVSEIKNAYKDYVNEINAQVLVSQKEDLINELKNYADASKYTYENLNKKALAEAIAAGTTNINAAQNYNAAVNAFNAAKNTIDAIPTDAQQLVVYQNQAIATLKSYKDAADYKVNVTTFTQAINNGVAAINAATTIEGVDSALAAAKTSLDGIDNDATVLSNTKTTLKTELDSDAASIISQLTGKDEYIAKVNAELTSGKKNIDAATTVSDAQKAKTASVKNMENILDLATLSISEYKNSLEEQLNEYATDSLVGYNDDYLTDSVQAALNNGLAAIDTASKNSGSEFEIKEAMLAAFEQAKEEIDQCIFDFENGVVESIVKQGQVQITDFGGNYETLFLEWNKLNNASEYKILIKGASYDDYTVLDDKVCYVQNTKTGYRADLLGLEAGVYSVKVLPVISGNESEEAATIFKTSAVAYDRSGFAHFNYTDGVGAYTDKGVLKDNAIVLYVTDDNKNTIELTYKGKTVAGIGNILNSVGQECGEAGHEGQCRRVSGKSVYYGTANTNAGILKALASDNIPLVVRFVGCVSNTGLYEKKTFNASTAPIIDGLTVYDSYDNGGSPGDNGHMARMQSAKNVTLEGIGSNATIDGWGFHFMCQTSDPDLAKNFEVRNLIFINTPEDAIGMEGQQEGGKITASVERCWIHHNEFYGPSIGNPAESDKKEGDGSCDFKRGQYLTVSYNYFEGCHKTNLVGSSDSSLQFNLTYHHNYWKYCKARGPLTRQANVHMYNNVFEGQTDYAMNTRANAYIYSEYNLFYMCKSPQAVESGAIKSFNDSFSSYLTNKGSMGTVVKNKTDIVSNSCKYGSIDYSKFDTTPAQSYIPSGDYILQENVTEARKEVYAQTGVQKPHRIIAKNVTLEDLSYLPDSVTPVVVSEFPTTLTPGKLNKTVYAFKINNNASVTLNAGNTAILVNLAGECLLSGDGVVVLEPGTYMVQAVNFQPGSATAIGTFKEMTISSISFAEYNSAEFDAKLIADFESKVAAIPNTITYTENCYQAIRAAINSYNALRDALKEQVETSYAKVDQAFKDYIALGKTRVETLISEIGTVGENSGDKIVLARKAYTDLKAKDSSVQISNYSTLVAAEEAFEDFALASCISKIDAIGTPVTLASKAAIEQARAEYDALTDDQQQEVTNFDKLVEAERILAQLEATDAINILIDSADLNDFDSLEEVVQAYNELTDKSDITDTAKLSQILVKYTIMLIDQIGTVTASSKVAIEQAENMYNSLSSTEKAEVTNYTTLTSARNAYNAILAAGLDFVFDSTDYPDWLTVSAGGIIDDSAQIDGKSYTKALEFKNGYFEVTVDGPATLVIHMQAGKKVNAYDTDNKKSGITSTSEGILEVTLSKAGTYKIEKNNPAVIYAIYITTN